MRKRQSFATMMLPELLDELTERLNSYRSDFANAEDSESLTGSKMIAVTVERLINSMKAQDIQQIRWEILTFSRQVSDAYFTHPKTMINLSETVQKIRNALNQ